MRREKYYGVPFSFDANIAPGGSATVSKKIDVNMTFYVKSLQGIVYTPEVVLTSTIAGTPYPDASTNSPGTAGNSFPTSAHFRVQIESGTIPWFNEPVPTTFLFGDAKSPHYFQTWPVITPSQDLRITLYNDTAATFNARCRGYFEGCITPYDPKMHGSM